MARTTPLRPTIAAIVQALPEGLSSQALVSAFQKVLPVALATELGQDVLLEAHYRLRLPDTTAVLLHAHQRKGSKAPRFHPCMGPPWLAQWTRAHPLPPLPLGGGAGTVLEGAPTPSLKRGRCTSSRPPKRQRGKRRSPTFASRNRSPKGPRNRKRNAGVAPSPPVSSFCPILPAPSLGGLGNPVLLSRPLLYMGGVPLFPSPASDVPGASAPPLKQGQGAEGASAKRLRVGAGSSARRSLSKRSPPAPPACPEPAERRKGKRCCLPASTTAATPAVAGYTRVAAEPPSGGTSPVSGVDVLYPFLPAPPGVGRRSNLPPPSVPWQPSSSLSLSRRAKPSVPDLIPPPKPPPKPG